MKNISTQFRGSTWLDWHDNRQVVPPALRNVAEVFINLQGQRHAADYDNHKQWDVIEVQALLEIVQSAFDDWFSIRTDPMAGNYLLAMLLSKGRL